MFLSLTWSRVHDQTFPAQTAFQNVFIWECITEPDTCHISFSSANRAIAHTCHFRTRPGPITRPNENSDLLSAGRKSVKAIDLYVTNKSLTAIYESCASVFVPASGQLAMDFMCGSWGASLCSALR